LVGQSQNYASVSNMQNQDDKRQRLLEVIKSLSLFKGGAYRLASGGMSDVFFDMKKTMFDPEGANLAAELILEILGDDHIDFIGGIEMGAVPVVLAVTVKSLPERPLRSFFVRKEAKGHGREELIGGHLKENSDVVLFDDVTTTGGSILKAVKAVRDMGCRVSKVISIVDRSEGARENLAAHGIELVSLFTRSDFEH